jgi:hypothetical protein
MGVNLKKWRTSWKMVCANKTTIQRCAMSKKHTIKPKSVDYIAVLKQLWKWIKHHFSRSQQTRTLAHPRPCGAECHLVCVVDRLPVESVEARVVWGIGQYRPCPHATLVRDRHLSGDPDGNGKVLPETAQDRLEMASDWRQELPCAVGGEQTGRNPTDRGKRGSKIHILVDKRGAPLSVEISAANKTANWLALVQFATD